MNREMKKARNLDMMHLIASGRGGPHKSKRERRSRREEREEMEMDFELPRRARNFWA